MAKRPNAYREGQPPNDPDWQALVKAAAVGEPLYVHLDPQGQFRHGIRGVYVVLTKEFRVRCGILTASPDNRGMTLTHYEGDREGAGQWLRYRGVPAVAIGLRLAECLHLYVPVHPRKEASDGNPERKTRHRADLDSDW